MSDSLARRSGRLLAPVGIAAAVVTLGAGNAGAASNLSVTRSDGSNAASSTTTSATCFKVVGTIPSSFSGSTTTLTVVDPSGTSHAGGSATSSATATRQISFQFSSAQLSWDGSCSSGGPVAPNGTYTAKLSGGVTASVPFAVAVPSATPQGFTGSPNGNVAVFSWQRNNEESDFTGYEITDSSGRDVTGVMNPGDVCNSSTCSASVDFGPSAAGTSPSFTIAALRSDGAGGTVASAPSSPATVSFPAPPPPPPSPSSSPSSSSSSSGSSSTGGSHGGTTGGTTSSSSSTGGATAGAKTGGHRALSGKHPAADLRAYLPLTSAGAAPNLPSVVTEIQPLPEGSYKPTLAYPDQVRQQAVRKQEPGTVAVAHDIVQVLDKKPLWRALAGAALLFLLAAHLRAWLARIESD